MRGVVILGPARCGSTLVSRMLARHPAVLSLSELFAMAGPRAFRPGRCDGRAFWAGLAQPLPGMSRIANPRTAPDEFLYHRIARPARDPARCPPLLAATLPLLTDRPDALFDALAPEMTSRPLAPLAAHYEALFAAIAEHLGGGTRVWVERSGGSLAAQATLRAMFPDATRLVMLRGGAETAASLRDYAPARVAIWLWRLGIGPLDPISPRHHLGRGALWPVLARLGGILPLGAMMRARPPAALAGRFWSALWLGAEADLTRDPAPFLRYESLLADPRGTAERLGQIVTGAAPQDWLAEAAAMPRARPARLDMLPVQEVTRLRAACAPGEAVIARLIRAGCKLI